MPPKSKPTAAAAGLVPGTLNQTQLDIIIKNRPHLAAKFRRIADLRVKYSGVTKALRPALKELAARSAQNLRDDDHYHLSGRNRQYYDRFKDQWDTHLQEEIARITAITTMKMEDEAAKRGYAQQEVGDVSGRKVEGVQADRMADIELKQTVFRIEHGLRGEGSGANGAEVERRRGQKHGMRRWT